MNDPSEMSGWTCSRELLSTAGCCWGLWKGTHSMAGNCTIERLSLGTSPGWTHLPVGACRRRVPTLQLLLGSFPMQNPATAAAAVMEIETSILTCSQDLPGNSKVRLYKIVWFASQLSPKGPALWISCIVGALTLFALWAVGIMFRKVRILLKCKNIIPKFALYQVSTLISLVRISLNCWYYSASLVLEPLLKIYGIFSH